MTIVLPEWFSFTNSNYWDKPWMLLNYPPSCFLLCNVWISIFGFFWEECLRLSPNGSWSKQFWSLIKEGWPNELNIGWRAWLSKTTFCVGLPCCCPWFPRQKYACMHYEMDSQCAVSRACRGYCACVDISWHIREHTHLPLPAPYNWYVEDVPPSRTCWYPQPKRGTATISSLLDI